MTHPIFNTFYPGPPLDRYVVMFWTVRDLVVTHRRERLLPTGTNDLILNLRPQPTRFFGKASPREARDIAPCAIQGPQSGWVDLGMELTRSVLGVHFRPGGIFPFLPLPNRELRDLLLPADQVWGSEAADLSEKVAALSEDHDRFRLVQSFLIKQLRNQEKAHAAVDYAVRCFKSEPAGRSIADFCSHIGFSQRRFIQLFQREIGLTPKRFSRLMRFQKTLSVVRETDEPDWADLALQQGFYDQAHLINEFKVFCGFSPTEYLRRRGPHRNHLAFHDGDRP